MNLPELLESVRHVEVQTSRLVTDVMTGGLFDPSPQSRRIACAMPDGNNLDFGAGFVDHKIDGVWPASNACLASFASSPGKTKWPGRDRTYHRIDFLDKPDSKSRSLVFIPGHRLPKFKRRFGVVDDTKSHFLYLASISSRMTSHGTPRPGFFNASSDRRSSSATCSCVSESSKPPNSMSMISTSSRRSASGIRRSASRISIALMTTTYPARFTAQGELVRTGGPCPSKTP